MISGDRHEEALSAAESLGDLPLEDDDPEAQLNKLLATGYSYMFKASLALEQGFDPAQLPKAWDHCLKAFDAFNNLSDTDIRDMARGRCESITIKVVTRMVDETEDHNRAATEEMMMDMLQGMSLAGGGGGGGGAESHGGAGQSAPAREEGFGDGDEQMG